MIRAIICVAAIALALVAAISVRAQSGPESSMMQPVRRWIDAYNSGTAPLPEDIFTDDVVITDEFPPFVWMGKAGEHKWASAIDTFIRPGAQHVSVGTAYAFQSSRDGTRVSFVLPATLTFSSTRTSKIVTQDALWLFVLVRNTNRWKIAADTWTTLNTASEAVSVPMRDEGGVLLLEATVDGVGPLLFTFDPGADDLVYELRAPAIERTSAANSVHFRRVLSRRYAVFRKQSTRALSATRYGARHHRRQYRPANAATLHHAY